MRRQWRVFLNGQWMTVITESEDDVKKLGELLKSKPTWRPSLCSLIMALAWLCAVVALGYRVFIWVTE